MDELALETERFLDDNVTPPWPSDDVPIRFRLGGVDLFRHQQSGNNDSLCLEFAPFDVAMYGLHALREMERPGRVCFSPGETSGYLLLLKRRNGVQLHCALSEVSARAEQAALLSLWEGFAANLRSLCRERWPAFCDGPHLRWEVAGGRRYDVRASAGTVLWHDAIQQWLAGGSYPLGDFAFPRRDDVWTAHFPCFQSVP